MTNGLFDDLEDKTALDAATVAGTSEIPESERFPCNACSGTGKYCGRRVHQSKKHCFACGGKGWFKTSARDRQKKTTQRHDRKRAKLVNTQATFNETNPGLASFLGEAGDWSEFARSLSEAIGQYGFLTDRQLFAANNMRAKCEAKKAEKEATKHAASGTVDLDAIRAMFDAAVASSLAKPVYRAEGLVLTLAPMHGRNPGAIYVKQDDGDIYMGKVLGVEFQASRDTTPGTIDRLQAIAAEPLEAAIRYGRLTGRCSCCGRKLTNKKSIELGIGPICRQKWGF